MLRRSRHRIRSQRSAARVLLAALLAGAGGCSSALLYETGLPWTQAEVEVVRIGRVGPFFDARLAGGGLERRFFTRTSAACRAVLEEGARVKLEHTGGFGPIVRGGEECPVAGIGELERLRGSRSRGGGYGRSPIRRGDEDIEIVHRDEGYLYARGGFSIGAMFGWAPGTDQVVALLPRIPACSPLAGGGPVSVLFRQAGTPALAVVAGDELCPVEGLIAVQPQDFEQPRGD